MYGHPLLLAENTRTATKATIKRASQAARNKMRKLDKAQLTQLEGLYRQAAEDIRAYLIARAGDDNTLRLEVMQTLLSQAESRLNQLAAERNHLLESGLAQAADLGVEPFAGALDVGTSLTRIADDAARFVTQFVAEDGLQLSQRIWNLDAQAREVVAGRIQQAVVRGWSATKAAQEFINAGLAVPKDVVGQMNEASGSKVGRDVWEGLMTGPGSPMDNAMRVFRTEINRAHGEAYQAAAFEHPDVIGTRFLLSPAHPRVDICDMHAKVNRYGLGPGVYPKDKNPWPAHPNTLSFTEVVFADEVSDEDKVGKQERLEWLKRQPVAVQYGVLGAQGKVAALDRGILRETEIATPWRVLKQKYLKKGHIPDLWTGGTVKPPAEPEPFGRGPLPGYQPAGTPKEAAEWAMKNNLADVADYSGSSVEVANAWNQSVYEHVSEFPKLRENLKFIGTIQARHRRWYQLALEDYKLRLKARNPRMSDQELDKWAQKGVKRPRTPGNVWAYSTSHEWVRGVTVNSKWAVDLEKFKQYLRMNVVSGFHPIGADTVKSVIDHELGHQLDDLLRIHGDEDILALFYRWSSANTRGEGLSKYARKNIHEFIAEAWAEYRNSDKPREIAMQIGQLIQKRYREKY